MKLIKKDPLTKKLNEFELIDINLLKGIPFEYGYVMHHNNRAIQKATLEEINQLMHNEFHTIHYIKLGPDHDFELFGSRGDHKMIVRKNTKNSLKWSFFMFFFSVLIGLINHFINGFENIKPTVQIIIIGSVPLLMGLIKYLWAKKGSRL